MPALAVAEAQCTRCPLYKDATQVVPGEGARRARLMLIGEQPGDREDLAGKRLSGPDNKPNLWVVNLDPHRPEKPANWSMGPVTASRAVVAVNQEVTFRTSLHLSGQAEYAAPYEVRLDVDEKFVRNLEAPREAKLKDGQVTLTFSHKFSRPGSRAVDKRTDPL